MNEIQPIRYEPTSFFSTIGNGFTLLGRTIVRSGLLTLVVVVPFCFLLADAFVGYMTAISEFGGLATNDANDISPEQMQRLTGPIFLFGGIVFLFSLAMLVVQTATTIISWEAAEGNKIGIGEALALTFRKPVWMVMIQTMMLGIIMALGFFAFMLIAAPLMVGALDGGSGGGSSLAGSILLALFVMGVVYFFVATIFRVHRVAIEERGPWRGLIASIALVKGNWWRAFGVVVLVYLMVTILSIPFTLLLGDDLVDMMLMARSGGTGGTNDPEIMKEFAENMKALFSWKFILAQTVQIVGITLLLSNFLTAMYIDLRARRGELAEHEDDEDTTMWGEPPPQNQLR